MTNNVRKIHEKNGKKNYTAVTVNIHHMRQISTIASTRYQACSTNSASRACLAIFTIKNN